jgi:hypothetical protein
MKWLRAIGQGGSSLDVLDHLGDMAAERGHVELGAPDEFQRN